VGPCAGVLQTPMRDNAWNPGAQTPRHPSSDDHADTPGSYYGAQADTPGNYYGSSSYTPGAGQAGTPGYVNAYTPADTPAATPGGTDLGQSARVPLSGFQSVVLIVIMIVLIVLQY
jgi:hypothetical protein